MTIQNKTIYLTPKYDYLFSDVEGAKNRFDYKKDKLVNCKIKVRGKFRNTAYLSFKDGNLIGVVCNDCTFYGPNIKTAIEYTG